MRTDSGTPLATLGIPPVPPVELPIPPGVVRVMVQLLWASHGDVGEAAARARHAAKTGNERERYQLIADFLDRCAKDPSIAHGALR